MPTATIYCLGATNYIHILLFNSKNCLLQNIHNIFNIKHEDRKETVFYPHQHSVQKYTLKACMKYQNYLQVSTVSTIRA